MKERPPYDDYDELLAFEGDFEGEKIITNARIYGDGNIQLLQGTESGPDDIIGINLDELEEIVEKAKEVEAE